MGIHVGIYMPTSGKEDDFVAEITSLCLCLDQLCEKFPGADIFVRGDSNVNSNHKNRSVLLRHLLDSFCLIRVNITHNTYHHFTGAGLYDSNIDVLLHSDRKDVKEDVLTILCKHDYPDMLSHHDMVLSLCYFPAVPPTVVPSDTLVTAPRLDISREKIIWTCEGAASYRDTVSPLLTSLRTRWLDPTSKVSTSVLLKMTNFVLAKAASLCNTAVNLSSTPTQKVAWVPRPIYVAKKKLKRIHRQWKKCGKSEVAEVSYKTALKEYKRIVRTIRLEKDMQQDQKLLSILSNDPSSIYSYIRATRNTSSTRIEKLVVKDKEYTGDRVADGFYDSMTSLKSCDDSLLLKNPKISAQFSNYELVRMLCQRSTPIPPLSLAMAAKLLGRLKKNVKDISSITALHYINAGEEGVKHFQALINAVLEEVDNATIDDLNIALGIILYKGHRKPKTSDRSYRTISTCPFLAKSIDLYLRDLHHEKWDACQAVTQYQGAGSNHELASLLLTEVIQFSLNVANKPVFLLALDAQSAFDRCLRQILVCELFKAGIDGDSLLLIDNRLASRSTVYEWDKKLVGPAQDKTGFEQGAINSSDFYKLYNNEQIYTAQASSLGVHLDIHQDIHQDSQQDISKGDSVVVSAIAQADDVILCANDIHSLHLLLTLTEQYCDKYRVKLVPDKTKLLGYATPRKKHLLDQAVLVNPLTIDGHPIPFSSELEHVGVVRNISGNLPNILNRISEHKAGIASVLSAGLSKGRHGNPAASLKVHELYGAPKLFSGLASLVLTKAETSVLTSHYLKTITSLQKLHEKTPRSFVFLLAGCLPGEAILHQKQLTLFMMICHLTGDPLHAHGCQVLQYAKRSAKSWFQQIHSICLMYGLENPLNMLHSPPPKNKFKAVVKEKVAIFWENLLKDEASKLVSLQYFSTTTLTLSCPHLIWTTATGSSFECRKATTWAKMASGRFRTEYLSRHWSTNQHGYCLAETCHKVVGDLEHLLLHCQALATERENLWKLFTKHSFEFPTLYQFLKKLEMSQPKVKLQFLMDPLAFQEVLDIFSFYGYKVVHLLYYLIRTYVYYIHRKKQILLGIWTCDNLSTKFYKKRERKNRTNNNLPCVSGNQKAITCCASSVFTTGHCSSPSLVKPSPQAAQPSLHDLATPCALDTDPGPVVHHCDTTARPVSWAGCTLASRDGDVQSAAVK